MSYLETFLRENPPDLSLRTRVLEGFSQDAENDTPLMFLANEFAIAGSLGLQMLATMVTDKGIIDQGEFVLTISEQGKLEFNAIVWGSLLMEINNCLKDGVFNTANVVNKINSFTESTGLPGMDTPPSSAEMVKKSKLQEMQFTHGKDPTDSLFFHEPYHLPNGVRKLLTEAGFFSSKDALTIVEAWKERALIVWGIPTEEFDLSNRLAIEELLQSLDDF